MLQSDANRALGNPSTCRDCPVAMNATGISHTRLTRAIVIASRTVSLWPWRGVFRWLIIVVSRYTRQNRLFRIERVYITVTVRRATLWHVWQFVDLDLHRSVSVVSSTLASKSTKSLRRFFVARFSDKSRRWTATFCRLRLRCQCGRALAQPLQKSPASWSG